MILKSMPCWRRLFVFTILLAVTRFQSGRMRLSMDSNPAFR